MRSLDSIRSWDGSQDRAFEELCYQLRDPAPPNCESWKLGNPDGGYEWFIRHRNGVEWGWQAKFTSDIEKALPLMKDSLRTVVKKRPRCKRLTFCVPFDLPDSPDPGRIKTAREKFEDAKKSWAHDIEGAKNIRIELWQAGDILERLALPQHRGRAWFFWDEEVFSPEWCADRLRATTKAAGDRYTPELNVELPIVFDLEALGRSDVFVHRYRRRRGEVVKASRRIKEERFTGLGVTRELGVLRRALAQLEATLPRDPIVGGEFARETMRAAVSDCEKLIWPAYPDDRRSDQAGSLTRALGSVGARLRELSGFLVNATSVAAESGTLLVTGGAGHGKTHLLCDASQRVLDSGRCGVVLLGQQFAGTRVFSDLAERLGLPPKGAQELLGAMAAAGEASGSPFVLLLDALNDSGDPSAWRYELPSLLAEVELHRPWVSLGVSVRSSYLDVIESKALDAMPATDHMGFRDKVDAAAQRFFASYGLEQPRVPLLLPEFTNPLFLRLYCEALADSDGKISPDSGHAHVTEVFDRYIKAKDRKVCQDLKLDVTTRPVVGALAAFAQAAAARPREWLPREEARRVVDELAPNRSEWPDTLFGRLLAEGLLTADVAYEHSEGNWALVDSVQITFQRLADYQIAAGLIESLSTKELEAALAEGGRLRPQVLSARAGLIEALAVLVPETLGVELMDAAGFVPGTQAPDDANDHMDTWCEATLASIVARRDAAVTDRTAQLLGDISQSSRMFKDATDALVTVSSRPAHPLNGEFLHAHLMKLSMPDRDSSWGFVTYGDFDERGPLDRLIRWAAEGPYPDYSPRVIELAALPLIWTLSSPNRFMRDYVTKALGSILRGRLELVNGLLGRFETVNDPYVLQRLAAIAYGVILVTGHSDPPGAVTVARQLAAIAVSADTTPDILLRDFARAAVEWCWRRGLVEAGEHARAQPPYGADAPDRPTTLKAIEEKWGRHGSSDAHGDFSSIFFSIFGMGDFGRYVIESDVSHFSRVPLAKTFPRRRKWKPKPSQRGLEKVVATFTDAQQAAVAYGGSTELLESLDHIQIVRLQDALDPPARYVRHDYPADAARRWVFERVVELGWTPERFGAFDSNYRSMSRAGRSGHKAERFGKKYQWIAHHELLARIADNFHMARSWSDESRAYEGPWHLLGRDIDPTLPPARRLIDDDGVEYTAPTYPGNAEDWWHVDGPRFSGEDAPAGADWAENASGFPETRDLIFRNDPAGEHWIVLQAFLRWEEEPTEDQVRDDRDRRDLWSHIYGWIVRKPDAPRLMRFLKTTTLMGRWMPEGGTITDSAYMPETPSALAAQEYPAQWEAIRPRFGDGDAKDPEPDLEVYSAWVDYFWEGNVWDCSIEHGVSARVPSEWLFTKGELQWVPGTRTWAGATGIVVAEFFEREDVGNALLVRESWLKRVLADNDWSLVFGRLGEKQLHSTGLRPGLVGGWTEIDGAASLHNGRWQVAKDRTVLRRPPR